MKWLQAGLRPDTHGVTRVVSDSGALNTILHSDKSPRVFRRQLVRRFKEAGWESMEATAFSVDHEELQVAVMRNEFEFGLLTVRARPTGKGSGAMFITVPD